MFPSAQGTRRPFKPRAAGPKPEPKILFQQFFKSVGPRTYVAQVKEAANGNHMIVLTEGKKDDKTGEIRKTRLFAYSEDFSAFFRLIKDTAEFIKAHPIDPKIKAKRDKFWEKKRTEEKQPAAVG